MDYKALFLVLHENCLIGRFRTKTTTCLKSNLAFSRILACCGFRLEAEHRTGAIDATRDAARAEADKARQCLFLLPDSRAREALLELCFRSVDRSA